MDNIGTLLSHNAWQSVIIFVLVFTVLKLVKSTSAEEKSWSWSAALFTLAILPLAAFLPGKGVSFESRTEVEVFPALESSIDTDKRATISHFIPQQKNDVKLFQTDEALINMPDSDQVFKGVIFFWMLGMAVAITKLVFASYNAYRLRRTAYPFSEQRLDDWPDKVEIAVSNEISGPIVIGTVYPLILIPRVFAFEMSHKELKPLLYHELAHIKRGDTVFHFVERIVLAIYWWNPIMHLIARNIAEEREHACDDRAARHCGDQLIYASSLVKGARKLIGEKKPVLGLAVLRRESVLSKRVKRLTIAEKLEEISFSRFTKNLIILFVSTLFLAFVTPRIAVGQVGSDHEKEMTLVSVADEQNARAEFEDIDQEIELELKDIPTDDEIQKMREEIGRELENFPTVEEMEKIREEALASIPTVEEIEKMRRETLTTMMTQEELEKIRSEAMESIPSIDELEKMRKGAMESLPTREELEEIRREALESLPTVEELAKMNREAMENIPTAEDIERMKKDILEGIPTKEEFEIMRRNMIESLESLPTKEELKKMRETVNNEVHSHLSRGIIKEQITARL